LEEALELSSDRLLNDDDDVFIYLFRMLHYFGVILCAVIYVLVSFAGDAVTCIMAPVIAFPLKF